MRKSLLSIEHLTKTYVVEGRSFEAVKNVSLSLFSGETVGLVGRSGCGKSTLAKAIIRLITPTSGRIIFDGKELCSLDKRGLKRVRKKLQMVFQDPYASLNPRMTIKEIIQEPLDIHRVGSPKSRQQRVEELLFEVGLSPHMQGRFPHEFSGGQRQRVGIARALALKPRLLVCDEPISALDVSIGAQVINLFKELQEKYNLTYLFIGHDLAVVKYLSKRIAVMDRGEIVELEETETLFKAPKHPVTKQLLGSIRTLP